MIVVLLIIIVILLLPGGVGFLARLWSAVCVLLGLACAYILWGSTGLWVIGGVAVAILCMLVAVWVWEMVGHRDFFSGGRSTTWTSEAAGIPPPVQSRTPVVPTAHKVERASRVINESDPFDRLAAGRVVKRVLPALEELLNQPGMVEVFRRHSKRLPEKSSGGFEIWKHPAGIYMAVPEPGKERLFSAIAAARDYHSQHST